MSVFVKMKKVLFDITLQVLVFQLCLSVIPMGCYAQDDSSRPVKSHVHKLAIAKDDSSQEESSEEGIAMSKGKTKPYFTVQVNVNACRFDIRVNDVPLIRGDGPLASEFPASQWVFTGKNELSIEAQPLGNKETFDEPALCEAIFYQRPSGSPREEREMLTGLVFKAAEAKESQTTGLESSHDFQSSPPKIIRLDNGGVRAERSFMLETPFPRWIWLDTSVIPNTTEMKNDLLEQYRQFWQTLNFKNTNQVKSLTKMKATEIAAAYYLPNIEAGHDRLQFNRWMANEKVYLADFYTEDLKLEVLGHGHLARLVDEDGDSPVVFVEKDESLAYYMPMVYCKTSDGKWLQIR